MEGNQDEYESPTGRARKEASKQIDMLCLSQYPPGHYTRRLAYAEDLRKKETPEHEIHQLLEQRDESERSLHDRHVAHIRQSGIADPLESTHWLLYNDELKHIERERNIILGIDKIPGTCGIAPNYTFWEHTEPEVIPPAPPVPPVRARISARNGTRTRHPQGIHPGLA